MTALLYIAGMAQPIFCADAYDDLRDRVEAARAIPMMQMSQEGADLTVGPLVQATAMVVHEDAEVRMSVSFNAAMISAIFDQAPVTA